MTRSATVVRTDRLEDHPDDDRADHGDDEGGDEPDALGEAELAGEPAADDRAEHAHDDVRETAAGRPTANDQTGEGTGEEAEDDPVEDVGHGRQSARSGAARNASTAATKSAACVWCAAWRAPVIVMTRPFRSRASSAHVAAANASALAPPRIWRTG